MRLARRSAADDAARYNAARVGILLTVAFAASCTPAATENDVDITRGQPSQTEGGVPAPDAAVVEPSGEVADGSSSSQAHSFEGEQGMDDSLAEHSDQRLDAGVKTMSPSLGDTDAPESNSEAPDIVRVDIRDEPKVNWSQPAQTSTFSSSSAIDGIGLWMGAGINGQSIPLGADIVTDAGAVDAAMNTALHIFGDASEEGVDLMWHTPLPFESLFGGVRFRARTDSRGGQQLLVSVGGPSADYWSDVAKGEPWPSSSYELTSEWAEYEFKVADLGLNGPAPHSEIFGALHFLMAPDQSFDLWLDDVEMYTYVVE